MILRVNEAERFYGIWWPLLRYVDQKLGLALDIDPDCEDIPPSVAVEARNALWENDQLRYAFIEENPAALSQADLNVVQSWDHRVEGQFFIFRYLKKHTLFLEDGSSPAAYGVLGLFDPLEDLFGRSLPRLVSAVLLPFEDKITYDSLLGGYNMFFGSGIKRRLNSAYRDAKERQGIITSLGSQSEEEKRIQQQKGNKQVLNAFRKKLSTKRMSTKTLAEHVHNINTFAIDHLAELEPPKLLLELNEEEIESHLLDLMKQRSWSQSAQKKLLTSFKHFIRFLRDTNRFDHEEAQEILAFLKHY